MVEEFFFRGVIQQGLVARLGVFTAAWRFTAVALYPAASPRRRERYRAFWSARCRRSESATCSASSASPPVRSWRRSSWRACTASRRQSSRSCNARALAPARHERRGNAPAHHGDRLASLIIVLLGGARTVLGAAQARFDEERLSTRRVRMARAMSAGPGSDAITSTDARRPDSHRDEAPPVLRLFDASAVRFDPTAGMVTVGIVMRPVEDAATSHSIRTDRASRTAVARIEIGAFASARSMLCATRTVRRGRRVRAGSAGGVSPSVRRREGF